MKSVRQINKWLKMLLGQSVLHVNQAEGKAYSRDAVRGYYNDFSQKVTNPAVLLDETGLVYNLTNEGKRIYFSIAIFQFGLGAYDLYLTSGQDQYRRQFLRCVDWAMQCQQPNGAWDTFSAVGKANPYSAMAQGEGGSLLVRAYVASGEDRYLQAAKLAIDFMCLSVEAGGCSEYIGDQVRFKEYFDEPVVLNGWIFSIWGVYDYFKVSSESTYGQVLSQAIRTLTMELGGFDHCYWSKYDLGGKLASPFYHRLHIAQLRVLHDLFGEPVFLHYADRWEGFSRNRWHLFRAFLVKSYQKLAEKRQGKTVIVG